MSETNHRIHHVFVTGLSTFPYGGKLKLTTYKFFEPLSVNNKESDNEVETYSCAGYYQLDPIPMFITEKLGFTITDVILLATKQVKKLHLLNPNGTELLIHR